MKKLAVFLAILFLCTVLCPSLMGMLENEKMHSDSAASSIERVYNFILPIAIPDTQIRSGLISIQAKNSLLQPSNKWINALLLVSILLYGCCMILSFYRIELPIQAAFAYSSEISLRIGGHAPPARIRC
jgi:hypothetical protein